MKILDKKLFPLPFYSLKIVIFSILLALIILVFLEKQVLPNLEQESQIVSQNWQRETIKINFNNKKKNLADGLYDETSNWIPSADSNWIWHSKGFLVKEEKTKPKRILVMGDSFVWGYGTNNMNDLWWRQLQREINRRGYYQVEVIAAGHLGASTSEQFKAAKYLNIVEKYQPDLMIWGYVTNDPDERIVKQFQDHILAQDKVISSLHNLEYQNFFPKLMEQLVDTRRKKLVETLQSDENGYEYDTWAFKLLEGKNWEKYQQTVKELGEWKKTLEIPTFMITLPNSPSEETFKSHYAKVQPIFEYNQIPFYNILDEFVAEYPSYQVLGNNLSWGINPADGHPGNISTHFYAVKALDYIEKNYPQILGKKDLNKIEYEVKINDWMPPSPLLEIFPESQGVYRFKYPQSEASMPYMPVERNYVQFNLENPVNIREIRLTGTGLQKAILDYTSVNPELGYDDHSIYSLGEKEGKSLSWNLENETLAQSVNTIRISANFVNSEREITMTIISN